MFPFGSLLNLRNSLPIVGDSWRHDDMIYNEELIRVKLSLKSQRAHTDIREAYCTVGREEPKT